MHIMQASEVFTLLLLTYGFFLCIAYPFVRGHVTFPPIVLFFLVLSPWSFFLFFFYLSLIRVALLSRPTWYVVDASQAS